MNNKYIAFITYSIRQIVSHVFELLRPVVDPLEWRQDARYISAVSIVAKRIDLGATVIQAS